MTFLSDLTAGLVKGVYGPEWVDVLTDDYSANPEPAEGYMRLRSDDVKALATPDQDWRSAYTFHTPNV